MTDHEFQEFIGPILENSLEVCSISVAGLNQTQLKQLSIALASNTSVREISLGLNKIEFEGAKLLFRALRNPTCQVKAIKLDQDSIGDEGFKALARALEDPNCKLTKIDLSNSKYGMTREIVTVLVKALKHKECKVTEINLGNNFIRLESIIVLAEALRDPHCSVEKINLWGNSIGDEGALVLADVLKDRNCKLTGINLESNYIGEAGALALAEAVKHHHCKVTEIYLGANIIKDVGARAFAEALNQLGCNVRKIGLWGNKIGDAGARAFADVRGAYTSKVEWVALNANKIGDAGAKALAVAISQGRFLGVRALGLAENEIRDEGANALVEALKYPLCKAQEMYLGENQIGDEASSALAEMPEYLEINRFCNFISDSLEPLFSLDDQQQFASLKSIRLTMVAKYPELLSQPDLVPEKILKLFKCVNANIAIVARHIYKESVVLSDNVLKALIDCLECQLPGQEANDLILPAIKILLGKADSMWLANERVLSYRLLLDAAQKAKSASGLTANLSSLLNALLQHQDYDSQTAGKLMAITQVMGHLGLPPILSKADHVTQHFFVESAMTGNPVVYQQVIIDEANAHLHLGQPSELKRKASSSLFSEADSSLPDADSPAEPKP